MKRLMFIFSVILMFSFFFFECTNTNQYKYKPIFSNKSQNYFENILSRYNKLEFSLKNEIPEIECLKSFDKEILDFVDSTKYFVNWEAKIKDIRLSTKYAGSKEYKLLRFTLYYEPQKHRKVEFKCSKLILPDDLENDLVYSNVKNIDNYRTVYFDGAIRKNSKGQIDYATYGGEKETMRLSYPAFNFYIFNLTEEQRSDSISEPLKRLLNIDSKVLSISNVAKKKNSKDYDKYIYIADSLRKQITPEEEYWRNMFHVYHIYNSDLNNYLGSN